MTIQLTHLQKLEAEAIFVIREAFATSTNPVLLYSIGKDSAVMLHLAMKAFHPAPLPFPLLHIASGWDFRAMLDHRDRMVREHDLRLIVAHNDEAAASGVNPFTTDTATYTRLMLTETLKKALSENGFDLAFGGGRRDEEKARAKERFFSLRSADHRWDPKNQRPEPWRLFNSLKKPGESFRVFPLSNWTEADIWAYIAAENVPIVPLYFAAPRPVVKRGHLYIMKDDERFVLKPGEAVETKMIRFRTLGCYPLTGGSLSEANDLSSVIAEMRESKNSERIGRVIDYGDAGSMEEKKNEGYF
jgi:sulfate adenylyltransferase subunit 2